MNPPTSNPTGKKQTNNPFGKLSGAQVTFTDNSAGITDAAGFMAAGAGCDIRNKGTDRLDIALICSKTPCVAAGVFTTNDIQAAPVRLSRDLLNAGRPMHGIIANSGNANACTGSLGMEDAKAMLALAEKAAGAPAGSFFIGSPGRIGELLPMTKLEKESPKPARASPPPRPKAARAAEAILTSDTRPKTCSARFEWQGAPVTVSGIAKGAGMIEPGMATMLAFIVTDAAIDRDLLQKLLWHANNRSFNTITVDGDMSTNDTVIVLANGASGVRITEHEYQSLSLFRDALNKVCHALAEKIVGDGEKITKVVTVNILGARTPEDAEKIARAIGNSLLVKSSWYGEDPNWGRLLDAAGYARIGILEEKINLFYNNVPVMIQGRPIPENKPKWKEEVKNRRFSIHMDLGLDPTDYQLLASDLSAGSM